MLSHLTRNTVRTSHVAFLDVYVHAYLHACILHELSLSACSRLMHVTCVDVRMWDMITLCTYHNLCNIYIYIYTHTYGHTHTHTHAFCAVPLSPSVFANFDDFRDFNLIYTSQARCAAARTMPLGSVLFCVGRSRRMCVAASVVLPTCRIEGTLKL